MNKYLKITKKISLIIGYLFVFWIVLLIGIINFIPIEQFETIYGNEMIGQVKGLKSITQWLFYILLAILIVMYIPLGWIAFSKIDDKYGYFNKNKIKSKKNK